MKSLLPSFSSLLLLLPVLPVSLANPRFYFSSSGSSACKAGYNSCPTCTITWESVWDEAGLRRYRFTFDGDQLIKDYGRDFLTRVRCHDGDTVANNWACWGPQPGDTSGRWTFDVSELDGPDGADAMNRAIMDVSGKWPGIPG